MPINPEFLILDAAPERYIHKASSVIVTIIKMAEGVLAFYILTLIGPAILDALPGYSGGLTWMSGLVIEALRTLAGMIPDIALFTNMIEAMMSGSDFCIVMSTVTLFLFLLWLLCQVIEAVALFVLLLAVRGAGLMKLVHRLVFALSIAFLLVYLYFGLTQLYDRFQFQLHTGHDFLSPSGFLIKLILGLILQIKLIAYHKDVVTVMSAIAYEISTGFKETGMDKLRLPVNAFLLGLISCVLLAVFLILGMPFGMQMDTLYAGILLVTLAIKYFMVNASFANFKLSHM